jgi:hypothetical protein
MRTLYRERRRRKFSYLDRPYVVFTLLTGGEVLLNRTYDVIAERASPHSIGHIIEEWRWVEGIAVERWLKTPRFPRWGSTVDCKRWSKDILQRFLDGRALDLQPLPIKRHLLLTGEIEQIDRDGVQHWLIPKPFRSEPNDLRYWPPPWRDRLVLHVDPADVPLAPGPMDRINRRLARERLRWLARWEPEPVPH